MPRRLQRLGCAARTRALPRSRPGELRLRASLRRAAPRYRREVRRAHLQRGGDALRITIKWSEMKRGATRSSATRGRCTQRGVSRATAGKPTSPATPSATTSLALLLLLRMNWSMSSQRADDLRPPPPRPSAAAAAAPLARPRRLGRRHGPEISRDLPRSPEIARDRPSPCSQVASCLHHYGDPATLLADPMSEASYSLFPAYARSKLAQAGPGLLSCRRAGARRERAEVAPGVGRPDGGAAAARGRERRGVCELAPGRRPHRCDARREGWSSEPEDKS